MTTKQKGDINELRCMTKFVELGFTVSKPISEDSRYDFVIEKEGKFLRMQAKKSRYTTVKREYIVFSTTSVHYRNGANVKSDYTEKDIDYFCTENNGNVYVVPVGETNGRGRVSLMLKENESKYVKQGFTKHARNYLADVVFGCGETNEYRHERVNNAPNVKCEMCGKEIYRTRPSGGGFICQQCAEEMKRGIKRPTKEVLEEEVVNCRYVDLAKKYNVSHTTIRRWAKEYGIVLPRKHRFFLTPPSPPDRRHVSTVPVSQWSKDGKFIRLYRSFVDTERYGFSQKAVSKCCHGRLKTYRGFLWKIESNENPSVISSLGETARVFESKSDGWNGNCFGNDKCNE